MSIEMHKTSLSRGHRGLHVGVSGRPSAHPCSLPKQRVDPKVLTARTALCSCFLPCCFWCPPMLQPVRAIGTRVYDEYLARTKLGFDAPQSRNQVKGTRGHCFLRDLKVDHHQTHPSQPNRQQQQKRSSSSPCPRRKAGAALKLLLIGLRAHGQLQSGRGLRLQSLLNCRSKQVSLRKRHGTAPHTWIEPRSMRGPPEKIRTRFHRRMASLQKQLELRTATTSQRAMAKDLVASGHSDRSGCKPAAPSRRTVCDGCGVNGDGCTGGCGVPCVLAVDDGGDVASLPVLLTGSSCHNEPHLSSNMPERARISRCAVFSQIFPIFRCAKLL